jgi:hypothetical protein
VKTRTVVPERSPAELLREALKRRHKYGARRTGGFASKAEKARYAELKAIEAAGEIGMLRTQVRFDLVVNEWLVCTYVADFVYRERVGSPKLYTAIDTVEDVKGYRRGAAYALFRLKAKLLRACHGIDVVEIGVGTRTRRPRARGRARARRVRRR